MSAAPSLCVPRPATPGDFDEIAEVLHRVFGARQTAETLRWKFRGPAGRLIGCTVLTHRDRIVGFLGQIPVRVRIMGREVTAAQGADMGILQEHRRLDAFLSAIQASVATLREEGTVLAFGTANAGAASAMAELLGQQRLASVPLLVRPLRSDAKGLPGLGARLLAHALAAHDRMNGGGTGNAASRLRLSRVERFDARFDAFWSGIRDDYPVTLVRDAACLNWRYTDAPGVLYERLCVENADDGRVAGYAVLGLRRRGRQLRGQIADLVTERNGDPGAVRLLVRAAVDWMRAQGADVAEAWAFPHMHVRLALVRRGFVPRRTAGGGFHFSVLPDATDISPGVVGQVKNWFLSMGDSDMA